MPKKMFLKLEGITGESQSPRHIGEIEISGFAWGEPKAGLVLARAEAAAFREKLYLTK